MKTLLQVATEILLNKQSLDEAVLTFKVGDIVSAPTLGRGFYQIEKLTGMEWKGEKFTRATIIKIADETGKLVKGRKTELNIKEFISAKSELENLVSEYKEAIKRLNDFSRKI